MKRSLVFSGALAACASSAFAAVSYTSTGGLYFQNFDTLATTGTTNPWANDVTLPGWSAHNAQGVAGANAVREASTATPSIYIGDPGSSTTGGLHSYGLAGSTDRALGSISSGTTGDLVWCLILQNNTTDVLTEFTLSYRAEQWRNGGNATAQLQALDYSTFAAAPTLTELSASNTGTYTAPGGLWDAVGPIATATAAAVDGNVAGLNAGRGGTATGLSWLPGEYLVIRWWDDNNTGNDHGIGIDDVNFTSVPTPGAFSILGLGALGIARRRRQA